MSENFISEFNNCQITKIIEQIDVGFKIDDTVQFKFNNKAYNGIVKKIFYLLDNDTFEHYACGNLVENEKIIFVKSIKNLIKLNDNESKIASQNKESQGLCENIVKYYLLIREFVHKELFQFKRGFIFNLINNSIIYTKDLDYLLSADVQQMVFNVLAKKQEAIGFFKEISENDVQYLYAIKDTYQRFKFFNENLKLIDDLENNKFVFIKESKLNGYLHKKEKIAGCYYYLVHVSALD